MYLYTYIMHYLSRFASLLTVLLLLLFRSADLLALSNFIESFSE
uniref:Uncharacterized protein n=1 Tax=Heterorhabditis bacteriophora TaxID=37862 RepID=A0A1I7WV09_HETBA